MIKTVAAISLTLILASSSVSLAQGTDKGTSNSSIGSSNNATATVPDPMNKGANVGMQSTSMHKKHNRRHKKHAM